jgi:hypothetical protein
LGASGEGLLTATSAVQVFAVPVWAIAVSGIGWVPVLVTVRDFAVGAESCVVVEPGGADLGEAQRRPERPGHAPGEAGVDGAAVAVTGGGVLAQEVPLSWPGWPQEAALCSAKPLVPSGGQLAGARSSM